MGEPTPKGLLGVKTEDSTGGFVLYDQKEKRYFAETKEGEQAQFTDDVEQSHCFSDFEISDAWLIAYKLAWLGHGKFFVHGLTK